MKPIHLDTWPRRSQYEFFRTYANPHFSITADVDVGGIVAAGKAGLLSIFNASLFAITGAANDVPEFRTRFRGAAVFECEAVGASVTIPIEDDRFAFCDVPWSADWPAFNRACESEVARAGKQTALANNVAGEPDWIYMTCLPWLRLTAMTHPVAGPDDCIPRIAWGRFGGVGDGWFMPVAVQVHHALVDGLHVGRFFEKLQQRLDRFEDHRASE